MLNALLLPENDPLHLQTHTLLIDTGLQLPFERQLSHGLAVLRKLLSISPSRYVWALFFSFFKCRILHNIIALLLSFPQLTSYWQKSNNDTEWRRVSPHVDLYLSCDLLVKNVGRIEMEFDILAFVITWSKQVEYANFWCILAFWVLIWIWNRFLWLFKDFFYLDFVLLWTNLDSISFWMNFDLDSLCI